MEVSDRSSAEMNNTQVPIKQGFVNSYEAYSKQQEQENSKIEEYKSPVMTDDLQQEGDSYIQAPGATPMMKSGISPQSFLKKSKISKSKYASKKSSNKKGSYRSKMQAKKFIDLDEQEDIIAQRQGELDPISEHDDLDFRKSPMSSRNQHNKNQPSTGIGQSKRGVSYKKKNKKIKKDSNFSHPPPRYPHGYGDDPGIGRSNIGGYAPQTYDNPQSLNQNIGKSGFQGNPYQESSKNMFGNQEESHSFLPNLQTLTKQMSKKNYSDIGDEPETHKKQFVDTFDDLKYGDSVTINPVTDDDRSVKLTTKYRISEKVTSVDVPPDEYSINSLFKILPGCQYQMQEKILDVIEEDEIPQNIEIDYENFISEIEANTNTYNLNIKESVRFEEKVQLYHDSSKRFLSFNSCKIEEVKACFMNQFSDSQCFYLGFSEYPAENTHFSIETVPAYQHQEEGSIKNFHFVYLTCEDRGKKFYLYNTGIK